MHVDVRKSTHMQRLQTFCACKLAIVTDARISMLFHTKGTVYCPLLGNDMVLRGNAGGPTVLGRRMVLRGISLSLLLVEVLPVRPAGIEIIVPEEAPPPQLRDQKLGNVLERLREEDVSLVEW